MDHSASFLFDERTIHQINPLGLRVLVEIVDSLGRSKGGLYIPDNAKDTMAESVIAKVVAVASAQVDDDDEDTNISGIPKDAFVLIENTVGIKVPWNERLRIVETADVLAIIDSIDVT